MTLPREEETSLIRTEEYLRSMLDPKQTPKLPKRYREMARRCLRHYPWGGRIEVLYDQDAMFTDNPEITHGRNKQGGKI